MTRIIMKSKIGTDGVLRLAVPVGKREANQEVQLTIEPLMARPAESDADYTEFLRTTAGAWQGDFERPEQGEFEVRDPLP